MTLIRSLWPCLMTGQVFLLDWTVPVDHSNRWRASQPGSRADQQRVSPILWWPLDRYYCTLRCGRPNLQTPPLSAAVIPFPLFFFSFHAHTRTHIPRGIGTLIHTALELSYGTLTHILIHYNTLPGWLIPGTLNHNTYTDLPFISVWENSDWVVNSLIIAKGGCL